MKSLIRTLYSTITESIDDNQRWGGLAHTDYEDHKGDIYDDEVEYRIRIPNNMKGEKIEDYVWRYLDKKGFEYDSDSIVVVWNPKDKIWTSNIEDL